MLFSRAAPRNPDPLIRSVEKQPDGGYVASNAVIVGVAAAMAKDLSPTKSNISRPPSSNWPQRTSSAFRMAEMKDVRNVFDN